MYRGLLQRLGARRRDVLLGVLVFAITLTTFLLSRVHQLADSKYSMVLSQSLLERRSFSLEHYALPQLEHRERGDYVLNGDIYQLEWIGDRLYYYLPPGSSVLSLPYVALMNALGVRAVRPDGTYDIEGDLKLQVGLAALLMAALAAVIFYTARLMLPPGWSALVAFGAAWGTQIWSTASRALWSDTWGILLLGIVVFMLLADAAGRHRLRPVLLASLLAWMYFVRPTYAVPIVAITGYLLVFRRRLFVWYAVTGLLWLAGFVAYSLHHFGQALPNYYRASRLTFDNFGEALAGNMISPSRGLLVYVPVLLFVAYLLLRYWKRLAYQRLAVLALSVVAVHWVVTSGFTHWYGGHSYGPRLMTGLVPWLVLLGVLGLQALLSERSERAAGAKGMKAWRAQAALGALLLFFSVVINALGATSHATALWNIRPVDVDREPSRVWDWRHPQFLAKWQ